MGKHVGNVVVAEQEDVVGVLHPIPEPERCPPGITDVIIEIIKIITEKDHAVMALRRQPVVGAIGMMVKVGNDQRAHGFIRPLEIPPAARAQWPSR